ncbi:MAG: hypothetical protein AB1485_03860, partial [Candidatus Thermoplasmatota archaeon]
MPITVLSYTGSELVQKVASKTYDFASGAGTDKWAYYGTDANGAPPAITSGIELTSYTEIASSDNTRYSTSGGGAAADPYHLFKFTIFENPATITQLDLAWEGYNDAGTSNFYIWNFTLSDWELLGSHTETAVDGTVTVSKTSGVSNYINASNYLYLCAIETTNSGTTIYTDYVYVAVTSKATTNFTFNLSSGWSFISLPLYNSSLTTAEQLADAIPCQYVGKWNVSSKVWEFHQKDTPENNFALENGTGYLVWLASPKNFTYEGEELPGVEINLLKGWNSIGWYEANATYPEKLLTEIENSTAVSYWNNSLGRFINHPKGSEISNFSITQGMGILIHVEADSIWDTLPSIKSVEHDAPSVLGPYDTFNVTLKGDEGYTATFDIETIVSGKSMTEESPGVYVGNYTVKTGDPSGTYNITGYLDFGRGIAAKNASTAI